VPDGYAFIDDADLRCGLQRIGDPVAVEHDYLLIVDRHATGSAGVRKGEVGVPDIALPEEADGREKHRAGDFLGVDEIEPLGRIARAVGH
jgi:hypothetical protein